MPPKKDNAPAKKDAKVLKTLINLANRKKYMTRSPRWNVPSKS
jgi:hypothetical protein